MAIQEQYVLVKKANGDVGITQNSVEVFSSVNASAVVNTLSLKEGMVGIGLASPTTKLHVQVADTINKQALLIEQLDTTNNPICAEINNDSTLHGLYLHQDGVLAANNYGLWIDSNAVQVHSPLVYFRQLNSSSNQRVLSLKQYGSGDGIYLGQYGNGAAFEIDNDGTGQALYIHQDGVLADDKYSLYIYSNAVQINAYGLVRFHQDNPSSSQIVHYIRNDGSGQSLFIQQTASNGKCLECLNSSNGTTVEINNDGTGHGLYLHQDGNLATGKYALYIDNNGTPVDGAGRAIRLDGCTISSTKNPETDTEVGFIAVNIDGVQYAVPYYALS